VNLDLIGQNPIQSQSQSLVWYGLYRRLKIPPWMLSLGSHLFIGSRSFQYYYISVSRP